MKNWLTHRHTKFGAAVTGIAAVAFATGFLTIQPLQAYWTRRSQPTPFNPPVLNYATWVAQASQTGLDHLSIQSLPVILQAALPGEAADYSMQMSELPGQAALNPLGRPAPSRDGFAHGSFVETPLTPFGDLPRLSTLPQPNPETGLLVAMKSGNLTPVVINTSSVNGLVAQPVITVPLTELTSTTAILATLSDESTLPLAVRYAHLPRL